MLQIDQSARELPISENAYGFSEITLTMIGRFQKDFNTICRSDRRTSVPIFTKFFWTQRAWETLKFKGPFLTHSLGHFMPKKQQQCLFFRLVFPFLEFNMSPALISQLIGCVPGAPEVLLSNLRVKIEVAVHQKRFKPRRRPNRSHSASRSNFSFYKKILEHKKLRKYARNFKLAPKPISYRSTKCKFAKTFEFARNGVL